MAQQPADGSAHGAIGTGTYFGCSMKGTSIVRFHGSGATATTPLVAIENTVAANASARYPCSNTHDGQATQGCGGSRQVPKIVGHRRRRAVPSRACSSGQARPYGCTFILPSKTPTRSKHSGRSHPRWTRDGRRRGSTRTPVPYSIM